MNRDTIQNLRYKLQKRMRRLNSADHQVFQGLLKQFWYFLEEQPLCSGVLDYFESNAFLVSSDVTEIIDSQAGLIFEKELESAVASYLIIKHCVESEKQDSAIRIAQNYTRVTRFDEMLDFFKDFFLEPFYEYIDEHLDDNSLILSILNMYKHKCEWFQREKLYAKWVSDTRRGEKELALHLYEYLFDQGIDFSIEPSSASGEADLVSSQKGDSPLIADVKIFHPEKAKSVSYISKGFRQLYDYTVDHNQSAGYLVIFNTSAKSLKFSTPHSDDSTPYVVYNNKTLFFICIDIFNYSETASKRGKIKPIEFNEEHLWYNS